MTTYTQMTSKRFCMLFVCVYLCKCRCTRYILSDERPTPWLFAAYRRLYYTVLQWLQSTIIIIPIIKSVFHGSYHVRICFERCSSVFFPKDEWYCPAKTYIAPEKWWLEDDPFLLEWPVSSVDISFRCHQLRIWHQRCIGRGRAPSTFTPIPWIFLHHFGDFLSPHRGFQAKHVRDSERQFPLKLVAIFQGFSGAMFVWRRVWRGMYIYIYSTGKLWNWDDLIFYFNSFHVISLDDFCWWVCCCMWWFW